MSNLDLMLRPVLGPLAIPSRGTRKRDDGGHFEPHFSLDNFRQGNVRRAKVPDIGEERTARASAARIELADASRNEVDQDLRVKNFFQCLFDKKSIHMFFKV